MKRLGMILIFFTVFVFTYSTAHSAIVVNKVKGNVAVKQGNSWKPLQKGQSLKEGSKISTGIRAFAILKIDGTTLKIRQLTMMKVYRNRASASTNSTHIGLKYGSLNARVKRIGKLKTSFKISTPVATSSVRGTDEDASHGAAFGTEFKVNSGVVDGETPDGVKLALRGKSKFKMTSGDSRPENPLEDTHDDSTQPLYDPNNEDERVAQNFVSDDTVGGTGDSGAVNFLGVVAPGGSNSTVNVEVTWPGDNPGVSGPRK